MCGVGAVSALNCIAWKGKGSGTLEGLKVVDSWCGVGNVDLDCAREGRDVIGLKHARKKGSMVGHIALHYSMCKESLRWCFQGLCIFF